ncbi:hypothetical protein M422DRAFT_247674 [Sphaerobolus stellatus SS14]|nr:hypothetical protein M422DRAFT_247674 [Sphaerobolus stellatus SS14]
MGSIAADSRTDLAHSRTVCGTGSKSVLVGPEEVNRYSWFCGSKAFTALASAIRVMRGLEIFQYQVAVNAPMELLFAALNDSCPKLQEV